MPRARSPRISPLDDLRNRRDPRVLSTKKTRTERHLLFMDKFKNVDPATLQELAEDLGDIVGNITIINEAGDIIGVETDGTPIANDFAKFSDPNTLTGRSYAETKTDLSLDNVENTVHSTDAHTMTIDGRDVSADGTKLDGIEASADVTDAENVEDAITGVSADTLTDASILPFVKAAALAKITWANVKATLETAYSILTKTIGIADDNLVEIDSASVADDEFARFTANGLESLTAAEVRAALDLEPGTDISNSLTAMKEADQTISGTGTGFTNDTHIVVALEAEAYYMFDMILFCTADDDAPDIKFDWTLPTPAPDGYWGSPGRDMDASSNSGLSSVGAPAANSATTIATQQTMGLKSGITHAVKFSGAFYTQASGSGNMQFRWGHLNSTGLSKDVTIKRGSCLRVIKIG